MSEVRRTIQNLEPGNRYVVRTRSVNPYGIPSEWSEALDYSLPTSSLTPEPPTSLSSNFEGKDAVITWSPPTQNTDGTTVSNLVGYNISITSPEQPGITVESFSVANQFVYYYDLNLQDFGIATKVLEFSITSVNTGGGESEASIVTATNSVPFTPENPPEATSGMELVAVQLSDDGANTDKARYLIQRSANGGVSVFDAGETSATVFIDIPPTYEETYSYRFAVRDLFGQTSGYSPWSDVTGSQSSNVVPMGGTTGQILAKTSNADSDLEWTDITPAYETTIGDDIATSFVVTHDFGTRDVTVSIYRNGSPYDSVGTYWAATTIDTVTIQFNNPPSTDEYRVVVRSSR